MLEEAEGHLTSLGIILLVHRANGLIRSLLKFFPTLNHDPMNNSGGDQNVIYDFGAMSV